MTKPSSSASRPEMDASTEDAADLRGWLAGREPPIPAALLRHLDRTSVHAGADLLETLLVAARRALEDARTGEGERRGAFRLLAADAYLTYACEVALEREDASDRLRQVLERVVHGSEGG